MKGWSLTLTDWWNTDTYDADLILQAEYESYLKEKKEMDEMEKESKGNKNTKPEHENSDLMDSLYNNRPTGD